VKVKGRTAYVLVGGGGGVEEEEQIC